MKLSELIQKAKNVLKSGAEDSSSKKDIFEKEVIVLKEKKNSVLIKCWRCGKELWVKKGSHCHMEGLCGICIQN